MNVTRNIATNNWGVLVLAIVCGVGCVESFPVDPQGYERLLVVQGRISDRKEIIQVKLSNTLPVDEKGTDPVSGAVVWIEDNHGQKIQLHEVESGIYESSQEVAVIPGNSYQLFITIPDDKQYYSIPEKLIASPAIDSIYYQYEELVVDISEQVRPGIQFFLDTHDDTGMANYYRYEWEETYEVQATFPSLFEYDMENDTIKYRDDYIRVCYSTNQSNKFLIKSVADNTEKKLYGVDLRYITNAIDQLKYRYSLLAKQYVISAEAFSFYRRIIENNESTGSLFSKQLGAVPGNVRSLDDENEVVLGFFEVSGYSEKRFFVSYEELDSRFPPPADKYPCSPDLMKELGSMDSVRIYALERNYGVINVSRTIMMAPNYCLDCRYRGPIDKPDFWIY